MDPSIWTDGARHANTYILPAFLGKEPKQLHSVPTEKVPYFIEYNGHLSMIFHNDLWQKIILFSRIISKELIIASLFIIKAILNPFSATFHVQ